MVCSGVLELLDVRSAQLKDIIIVTFLLLEPLQRIRRTLQLCVPALDPGIYPDCTFRDRVSQCLGFNVGLIAQELAYDQCGSVAFKSQLAVRVRAT